MGAKSGVPKINAQRTCSFFPTLRKPRTSTKTTFDHRTSFSSSGNIFIPREMRISTSAKKRGGGGSHGKPRAVKGELVVSVATLRVPRNHDPHCSGVGKVRHPGAASTPVAPTFLLPRRASRGVERVRGNPLPRLPIPEPEAPIAP